MRWPAASHPHAHSLPFQTLNWPTAVRCAPPAPQTGFLYFACFMKTMRREWFGIDRLRLDKYMMLIRKFVAQLLRHLAASKW